MRGLVPYFSTLANDVEITAKLLENEDIFMTYVLLDKKSRKNVLKQDQCKIIINNLKEAVATYNVENTQSQIIYNYVWFYKKVIEEVLIIVKCD